MFSEQWDCLYLSRVCIFEEIYSGIKTGYIENRHETIWKFHDAIILAKIAAINDIVPTILRIYLNSSNGTKTHLNHLRNDHRKEKSVVITEMEPTLELLNTFPDIQTLIIWDTMGKLCSQPWWGIWNDWKDVGSTPVAI